MEAPRCAIIRVLKQARQRAIFSVLLLGLLASGCEARSSVEAAQTAVVAVQTAVPISQSAFTTALQGLLAGANLSITTAPDGASTDAVTQLTIRATDTQGTLAQVDVRARQAAVTGALALAAQYYPNATISLTVSDASGATLVSGSKAPGQAPAVQ
jgi:hypothetical protein